MLGAERRGRDRDYLEERSVTCSSEESDGHVLVRGIRWSRDLQTGVPLTEHDTQLFSKHVIRHGKSPPSKNPKAASPSRTPSNPTDVCKKFNEGKCTAAKCPWGRPHTCSTPPIPPPRPDRAQGEPPHVTGFRILDPLAPSLPLPPPRPNTTPRANKPLADTSGLPTITTTLHEGAWTHYLRDYPDRTLVDTLMQIIRHGANIGFSGDRKKSQTCTNLKSAFESPRTTATLLDDIVAQVANGRTRGPFAEPPFSNFRASPLGAVTRKRSTKIRRIHHLSWPEGDSVNDGIPDSEASITYDMVDRAINDLIESGPGCLMMKLDLESAFRHIPVRPADWPLLGFVWQDKFYFDIVLGFGCRAAPYIFNLFAEALHWILQRNIPARLRHYLDDFLGIFAPDVPHESVQTALTWAMDLGAQLGLNFQPSKIVGPDTSLEFLGLELEPWKSACLPTNSPTSLNSSTTGPHGHTAPRMSLMNSRAFCSSPPSFSASFPSRFSRRRISNAARSDITWWRSIAADWNGIRFLSPSREAVHFYTDASGAKGLGGHFGKEWYSIRCPRRMRNEHIQVKEMYAVIQAILRWGLSLTGKHAVFHVDNEAVFNAINNFTIRSAPTMKLVQHLIALACRLDFTFSSVWLSSAENSIADAASRFSFTRMFELAPYLNKQPSSKRLQLGGTTKTAATQKPLHFTFGTVSPPALGKPTQPDNEPAIMSWIANLAGRVQPKTIKAYLSAVRSLHTDADLPFTACESPVVQRLIRGIKRYHGEKDRKPVQAITLPVLTDLLAQLKPGISPGHTAIYAACCLAYSGLLRSGEFTTGKGKYNASLHLSRQCVKFIPSIENATHVQLTLPASKTDPFRKGIAIIIAAAPDRATCPVAALKALFAEFPRPLDAPLFEQPDGKALTYDFFVKSMRDALELGGHKPSIYAGHSFRRGAASEAAAAGYSDYEIQLLGRWRSDAYRLYIEADPNRLLHLSSLLHMAHTHTIPFEPPALRNFTALA
ncbi:hypothetical protein D9615_003302 [Tricholomella constricta]|uniref:Reverse transcriptase domain-containing protein n=1 Tax=Tricholomella constricta TaxID=117010 RepID=A0A8H5HJF2_9AGAR|nr:hypothetical protein D9615_003302 [Tricholomella constricta]